MNISETFLSSLRPPPPPSPNPGISLHWREQILNLIAEYGFVKWNDKNKSIMISIKWEMDKMVSEDILVSKTIKEKEGFFPLSKKEYIVYKNKIQHQREEKLNQILN
jgi:hypothetical protein